jgi:hypothetical protein
MTVTDAAKALIAALPTPPTSLIIQFQQAYNANQFTTIPIAVTGIMDAPTQDALAPYQHMPPFFGVDSTEASNAASVLSQEFPNAKGVDIEAFQKAYNEGGYTPPIAVDGVWGTKTANAFGKFYKVPGTPIVKTALAPQDFANALAVAWPAVIGGVAPEAAIAVLLAQSAYETGQWANCYNYNFGNITHVDGDGYDYFIGADKDGSGHWITHAFRSFDNAQDGVTAYLSFLKNKYASAWQYVLDGDPSSFVDALKAHGYFEGNLQDYKNSVNVYFDKFRSIIPTARQVEKAVGIGAGVYIFGGLLFLGGLMLYERYGKK